MLQGAITCLLSLFGDHIGHIGREDLLSHMTQLQSFFMTCLNIRIDYPEVSYSTVIWASSRENLFSGFPTKRVSNQSPQLQRLA